MSEMSLAERAQNAVEDLQDRICAALEGVEERSGGGARFVEDAWERPGGGGGRTRVLADGAVLEKAGVNTSAVHGELPEVMRERLPGEGDAFFATGVSLVLHPKNPNAPTTHANFRYIQRGETGWFGGGADLTPFVLYEDDARHFHAELAAACDAYDPEFYPRFKAWCDRYFYLPHREEARGIGGVFFDWVRPDDAHDLDALFDWWRAIGEAFLPAYLPILERRKAVPFDDALRTWQLVRRGRYVEFNLLHDRGTKFGLQTAGRIESILMSLPPLVRWDYGVPVAEGSPEARLLEVLRDPVDWLGRGEG